MVLAATQAGAAGATTAGETVARTGPGGASSPGHPCAPVALSSEDAQTAKATAPVVSAAMTVSNAPSVVMATAAPVPAMVRATECGAPTEAPAVTGAPAAEVDRAMGPATPAVTGVAPAATGEAPAGVVATAVGLVPRGLAAVTAVTATRGGTTNEERGAVVPDQGHREAAPERQTDAFAAALRRTGEESALAATASVGRPTGRARVAMALEGADLPAAGQALHAAGQGHRRVRLELSGAELLEGAVGTGHGRAAMGGMTLGRTHAGTALLIHGPGTVATPSKAETLTAVPARVASYRRTVRGASATRTSRRRAP